jgi:hypothetical protein
LADIAFDGVREQRRFPLGILIGLAAVAVIGLVLFFVLRDDPKQIEVKAPREQPTQAGYAGAITDLAPLVGTTSDRKALDGREVALEGVQVVQVLGERTFLVGPGLSQKAVVVWQPEAGAAAAAANTPAPKIDVGDTVAIHGVVQPMPASAQTLTDWRLDQLSPSERTALQVVVVAKDVIETSERSGQK